MIQKKGSIHNLNSITTDQYTVEQLTKKLSPKAVSRQIFDKRC